MPEDKPKPKVEKIDILGLWKIIFAGKKGEDAKILLKSMFESNKHTNIQLRNDMSIDVHEKNEETNQYKSILRKWFTLDDIKKFVPAMMDFTKMLEPIDITSEAYRELTVLPFVLGETFHPKVVKKEMIVDSVPEVNRCKLIETINLRDGAFVVINETGDELLLIVKTNGIYFKVEGDVEAFSRNLDEAMGFSPNAASRTKSNESKSLTSE